MVSDVLVDSEMVVVTSLISSRVFAGPIFEGVHRGRICVHAFIGVSALYYVISKKCCI